MSLRFLSGCLLLGVACGLGGLTTLQAVAVYLGICGAHMMIEDF